MTDYYVAKTGKDSNPDTEAEPKLTIAETITLLSEGDVLHIGPGEYND